MRSLRYLVAFCFVTFCVGTTVLAIARPDLSVWNNQISDLLEGPDAVLARALFVTLATGASVLGYLQSRRRLAALATTSWLYAAACLVAGLTPPRALVHNSAALTALSLVPVAIGLTGTLSRQTRIWLIGLVLATLATWPLGVGLGERITVYGELAFLTWSVIVVTDVQRSSGETRGSDAEPRS